MKIERAIRGPCRELLEIIMDKVVGSDDRQFPAELGATPRPIKIDIGKWKIFLVESIALLPGFALNQERTGENDIAGAPANSVAEPPGRVVRSVQIQSRGQILSERERERGWESHSVTEKTAVALCDRKAGSGELRFQLEKWDGFFQRLLVAQPFA